MINYITYVVDTGRIMNSGTLPDAMPFTPHIKGNIGYMLTDGEKDYENFYVYQCTYIKPRPAQATTLTGQTITGFPEGATLTVKGQSFDITGETEVTLNFQLPGEYPVKVICWPYLDWEGVIHVD